MAHQEIKTKELIVYARTIAAAAARPARAIEPAFELAAPVHLETGALTDEDLRNVSMNVLSMADETYAATPVPVALAGADVTGAVGYGAV